MTRTIKRLIGLLDGYPDYAKVIRAIDQHPMIWGEAKSTHGLDYTQRDLTASEIVPQSAIRVKLTESPLTKAERKHAYYLANRDKIAAYQAAYQPAYRALKRSARNSEAPRI